MSKKYIKNNRAFTLMELMLIVSILGLIAAVGAPYLNEVATTFNDGTAEQMTVSLISKARSMGVAGRVKESNISFKKDGTIILGSSTYKLPSNFSIKDEKSFKFGLDGKVEPASESISIQRKGYEKQIYVR